MKSARKELLDMSLRLNAATRAMERHIDNGGVISAKQMLKVYEMSAGLERVVSIRNSIGLNEVVEVYTTSMGFSIAPDGHILTDDEERTDAKLESMIAIQEQ